MPKIETVGIHLRIPKEWAVELAALATMDGIDKNRRITIQDEIRVAIIKQFFLGRNEYFPEYDTWKPMTIANLPEITME